MSLCCQVNWACNFLVGAVFPLLNERLGYLSFLPFAAVLLVTFVAALLYFPVVKPGEVSKTIERRRRTQRKR